MCTHTTWQLAHCCVSYSFVCVEGERGGITQPEPNMLLHFFSLPSAFLHRNTSMNLATNMPYGGTEVRGDGSRPRTNREPEWTMVPSPWQPQQGVECLCRTTSLQPHRMFTSTPCCLGPSPPTRLVLQIQEKLPCQCLSLHPSAPGGCRKGRCRKPFPKCAEQ